VVIAVFDTRRNVELPAINSIGERHRVHREATVARAILAHQSHRLIDHRDQIVARELPVLCPAIAGESDAISGVSGVIDLVLRDADGENLVVIDYKTDAISEAQLLQQAGHHARQLQLYGRGLTQASGLKVRERLVVFTELGKAVPV